MDYFVVKTINNNVVLARNSNTDEQVILMSKGIGFNKKLNDKVSDIGGENQIFKLWNNGETINNLTYDKKTLKLVVEEIAQMAQERLGIDKESLIEPMIDHIIFLVDRINFGIYTENPFQNEISILYANEYEIARYAVELIKERLDIDAGESEVGLITLHLNSAMRKKPIATSIEQVRIYNKISKLIISEIGDNISDDFIDVRIFLMALDKLVKSVKSGKHFKMDITDAISLSMKQSYNIALNIAKVIKNEMDIQLLDSDICFITIDIERLTQLYVKREG